MNALAWILAATLSAGNAEFDRTATEGARTVAVGKAEARLAAEGPKAGGLTRRMLEKPSDFSKAGEAKTRCRAVYRELIEAELAAETARIDERLGLPAGGTGAVASEGKDSGANAWLDAAMKGFDGRYERERRAACDEQAKSIAGRIRPAESDVETKDEAVLRREMTEKVAAQQKDAVFEENLKYISEKIVDPVIDSAKNEMKRQRDYLMRTECDAYAPSALAREIEGNLRRNVSKETAKAGDPSLSWGVFPKTLREGLAVAVERRTLGRVAKGIRDVPVAVDAASVLKTMEKDPAAHRKVGESEKIFRTAYAAQLVGEAIARAEREAPSAERAEFAKYAREHAAAADVARAVEARLKRDVLPKWRAARTEAARAEADRLWPTLSDGTWYPEAELADRVAARSDYGAAVKGWRREPELEKLAKAGAGRPLMEETEADADASVSAAFDLARSAIAAQNALVGEAEPVVLREAKDRKSSFWRRTPDLKAIVELLTGEVEKRWADRRVQTLWGDGERPANAAEQHAELFPSVRRRIELVARSIFEQMEKPEARPEEKPKPEEKPEPEEPEPEDPKPEEPEEPMIRISVKYEGDRVTIKVSKGSLTYERTAKAKMSDYREAMKYISDKLGTDILKLK